MRRLRKIRNPERFASPRDAAQSLRRTAAHIEQLADWMTLSIKISFATEEEVRESLRAKRARLTKRGAVTAAEGAE